MSIGVIEEIFSETFWYDLQSSDNRYVYSPAGLSNKNAIRVKVYPKSGSGIIFARVSFLNSSAGIISEAVTETSDTQSTNNISEISLDVPSGAVSIALKIENNYLPAMASVEYITFSNFAPLSPIKYSNSQSITITNTANIALLGGGGAAGSISTNTTSDRGGGGSGYLTHGSISPGNYSLTIGAGGNTGTPGGSSGGTTSFSTFNAAGGVGTSSSNGGAGGSGGGRTNQAGGFNGNTTGNTVNTIGGTPSGVVAQLFAPASAGGALPGGAGGLYAGGAGGQNALAGHNGTSGAANTGGGGGGCRANANNYGNIATGGNGGSGALWVLQS
jgi:hypothetical protein